jgi:Ca2+-binding EF-hand superfamily protein
VAAIDPKTALNEFHFEQAFQYFDIDHSGMIKFEEIVYFLEDTK